MKSTVYVYNISSVVVLLIVEWCYQKKNTLVNFEVIKLLIVIINSTSLCLGEVFLVQLHILMGWTKVFIVISLLR